MIKCYDKNDGVVDIELEAGDIIIITDIRSYTITYFKSKKYAVGSNAVIEITPILEREIVKVFRPTEPMGLIKSELRNKYTVIQNEPDLFSGDIIICNNNEEYRIISVNNVLVGVGKEDIHDLNFLDCNDNLRLKRAYRPDNIKQCKSRVQMRRIY